MRLLDSARDQPLTALQEALIARLRARAEYALQRERDAARTLLAAAQGLDGLDPALARDTYIEALAAALYGGRLGDADVVAAVARAILAATADDESERARDLLLRGQALLAVDGHAGGVPDAAPGAAARSSSSRRTRSSCTGCGSRRAPRSTSGTATRCVRSPTARSSSPAPPAS